MLKLEVLLLVLPADASIGAASDLQELFSRLAESPI